MSWEDKAVRQIEFVDYKLLITNAGQAILFIALVPDVEKRSGNTEEAAGLTEVAAHELRMLQHAQRGLHLLSLNLHRLDPSFHTSCVASERIR